MGNPVHRTILLLDVEKFGPRLHLEQAEAQRVLYDVLRRALTSAGIEQTQIRSEDRGDGVFVLVDATVAKVPLVRSLLTDLPTALYDYNRLASASSQVRLRAVLHAGDVEITPEGVVGPPVVEAFRLLNSDELRDVLTESADASVLCVSEAIHHDVVRHDHSGVRVDHFQPLVTKVKEGPLTAWVHAPGRRQASPQAPTAAGGSGGGSPGGQATSGNFFSGTVTVGGDVVGRDKTVHGGNR